MTTSPHEPGEFTAGLTHLPAQPPHEWLFMRDDSLSAPMKRPVPITDVSGVPRYYVTHTRSWPSDRYEVATADGGRAASIRQRHYGSVWHRAVLADGQEIDIKKDFFDADRWLRLKGMGLVLTPWERYRPYASLATEDGTDIAWLGYRRADERDGAISTKYAIGIVAPGWEDVAVAVFALVRHEYLDYFDVVRGSGTP